MADNDRNDPSRMAGQSQDPQQSNTGAPENNVDANPQQGDQWDNYQTRTLSAEGGPDIKESDLLSADDAQKQQGGERGNS